MPTAVYVLAPKPEGFRKERATTATPTSGIAESTRHIDRCFTAFVPNRVASGLISELKRYARSLNRTSVTALQEVGVDAGTFLGNNRWVPAAGGNVFHYTRLFYDLHHAR